MYPELERVFGEGYASYHSFLYSAYALPNLLLPILFSSAVNGSSSRKMLYTYSLIVVGQMIVTIGAFLKAFEWMVAGRFIIGLGGESFSVAQNKMLSTLFKSNEHGRVFGISIAIGRLGSIFSYLLINKLISNGIFFCSTMCTVLIGIGGVLILAIDRIWDNYQDYNLDVIDDTGGTNHHLLPHILMITVLIACAVSPFSSASSAILQKRLTINYAQASRVLAVQETMALGCTIIVSVITDKIGHRLTCVTLGGMMLSIGHALLVLRIPLAYLPSILIGLSSGLLACCWPCIPLLIPPSSLSMGLSLLSCGVNLAYTICPTLISKINDASFKISEYYTTVISILATMLSLYIVFINAHRRYGLNGKRALKI
ncbi:hypothetical protein NEOKW01_1467 [Nematocida sp. AWRm80]|nr:hypothetical protein NEOKW01_1467 [Nematocida sp. AWRm80]